MKRFLLVQTCVTVMLTGCGPQPPSAISPPAAPRAARTLGPLAAKSHRVEHVVIVIQENRSVDNLFNGLPGADIVRYGKARGGRIFPLRPESLVAPYDLSHKHRAFEMEYDGGLLDGFNRVQSGCKKGQRCPHERVPGLCLRTPIGRAAVLLRWPKRTDLATACFKAIKARASPGSVERPAQLSTARPIYFADRRAPGPVGPEGSGFSTSVRWLPRPVSLLPLSAWR